MGTHPIFESDFDCLTVFFRRENGFSKLRKINRKLFERKMKVDYGEIIFQSTEGITEDQVEIDLKVEYNRNTSNPKIEELLEEKWKQKTAENSRLYSQSKFRLHSLNSTDSKIGLNIGLSSYKDFNGTNQNDEVFKITDDRSFISDIIGVNGVLRTSDGYIIITKRAEWVGEHPGMLDTPGGHPEPSAVDPMYDLKVNSQEVFKNVGDMDKKKVIKELFKSQQEEMELEFNIESKDLSYPVLYSIGRIRSGNGRPVFYYFIQANRTKDEIASSWSKGGNETDESTKMFFIQETELKTELYKDYIWGKISDNGKMSLETFLKFRSPANQ